MTTILRMPDGIELARLSGHPTGMIEVTRAENLLYIRPRAGLRAGTEVSLLVQTPTVHKRFLLRVVRRARDAWSHVTMLGPDDKPAPDAGDSRPTAEVEETSTSPALAPIRSPRTEISVHVVGSMGFTGLDIPGQQPFVTRLLHAGFGGRMMVTRRGAWWALETNFTLDLPDGAMSFDDSDPRDPGGTVEGSWLRMEVGMRALLGGTKWNPSLYAGAGVQAHLRRTKDSRPQQAFSETMPRGAVLVLGIGLQRRVHKLVMGLDFQVREGAPDGYHSAAVLWSAGFHLDPD
ncbi:MAG TPA: hypothetical protein VNM90_19600 [Haliangium sp.]|nr:hypothetical protein [Haliangium sp.]